MEEDLVKDPQGNLVQGRTRWRRFAALMIPATALAGAIVFGMANGAIAASFAVSGQTFKVSASKLDGEGFRQYGGVVTEKTGETHPVAVSGIDSAKLYDLCQSVKVPNLPVVLTINAGGGGDPATATDLLLDVTQLEGDATFTNIDIGVDASAVGGEPGAFGQRSDRVVITDLKQVAWSTSAGTFNLKGLKLKVNVGADAKECFVTR
jgi:uncharacterized protein DUF6230